MLHVTCVCVDTFISTAWSLANRCCSFCFIHNIAPAEHTAAAGGSTKVIYGILNILFADCRAPGGRRRGVTSVRIICRLFADCGWSQSGWRV